MCGIAGIWSPGSDCSTRHISPMVAALFHRGPDDGGNWQDSAADIALGHRRLAVVDLSPAGAQPMRSLCGKNVMVFNGEIYNHAELRKELEQQGHCFSSHSDTEVLLTAIGAWGAEQALRRCSGMFAFAVWNREERTLLLGRDRMGEKPLYYGLHNGIFAFASELKALAMLPQFCRDIDRHALAHLMRHNYIAAPRSIYQGVFKLTPGCTLKLDSTVFDAPESLASHIGTGRYAPVPYWSFSARAHQLASERQPLSDHAMLTTLDQKLRRAIGRQMVADVPVGAFLSGGIDSSLVTALMQDQSTDRKIHTFSIGFDEKRFDESPYARRVADHLGTDHTEFRVTPAMALELIPALPEIYDEPFADASQIPTVLLCRLARQHVTVALSGDAGDELFAGYDRYSECSERWLKQRAMPPVVRKALAHASDAIRHVAHTDLLRHYIPADIGSADGRLARLAAIMRQPCLRGYYQTSLSQWLDWERLVPGGEAAGGMYSRDLDCECIGEPIEQMMFLDSLSYLPDDILVKVDRAAMAASLETRVPLLDHEVVEFAWQLTVQQKMRGNIPKWPLRKLLAQHLPTELFERPKMGFGIPLAEWLRGSLRDWAEELLEPGRMEEQGLLDSALVQEKWREHLAGRRNWQYPLWNVLMFQAWYQRWHGGRTSCPLANGASER